jgi:hypothetical protein
MVAVRSAFIIARLASTRLHGAIKPDQGGHWEARLLIDDAAPIPGSTVAFEQGPI